MDFSNLNNVFIINTILKKLDLERDLHLMVLAYLIYNYLPVEKAKKYVKDWWYGKPTPVGKKNMVVFRINEETSRDYGGRPDRYLAVMDKIRECKSVYQTESIHQKRYGNSVNVYEVHQKDSFLIDPEKNIHGEMIKEKKSDAKGNQWTEINLEIFSYKSSHEEIVNWIEEVNRVWLSQWQGILRQKTKYVIEITGKKEGEGLDWTRYPYKSKATFENTFFPGKETLMNELKRFKEGEDIYRSHGWPWQFGVALTGTRGTGKTRILKCISHYMERHLFVIKMNEYFTVSQLVKAMHGLVGSISLRPDEFIVVFEEISDQTNMIRSRDDEDEEKHESVVRCRGPDGEEVVNTMSANYQLQQRRKFLSEFLPAIDGINERYGGMIIMTTNYVERLDKALIRPGRIDFHLHMEGGYDRHSTFQVLKNILGDKIKKYTEESLHANSVNKYTGAELIQLCRRHQDEFEKLEEMFFKNGKGSTWGTFRLAAED